MIFPKGFVFGSATAAYQVEGGVTEDGRSPSIWDTFSHLPGKTHNGDTGDIADDHYHRFEADLDLMAEIGLDAYRFSIAWPRVVPTRAGDTNHAGLDFYSRLVDGLLKRSIMPAVTLYHWDLPQWLEDDGGWTNRATADAFADYAAIVGSTLGDRVSMWTTLNEPWCSAYLGYASGVHAPGRTDRREALLAVHNLNRAHGLAIQSLRSVVKSDALCSVTLNLHVFREKGASGREARSKLEALGNDAFLGPMLDGSYPTKLIETTSSFTDWSFVRPGDLACINQPIDVLGVNYYNTNTVRIWDGTGSPTRSDGHGMASSTPWPGAEDVEFLPQTGPITEMGWNIDAGGLGELLRGLSTRYPDLPLIITENGAAFDDIVTAGEVHDTPRIDYLHAHLAVIHDALTDGVDVRGYYLWSLMDNFEWSYGYSKRFGIIRVDYETQQRTLKDSAKWFKSVIAIRATPEPIDIGT